MRSPLLALLAVAGLAAVPAAASAKTTTFKVVKATHTSSAAKTSTAPVYTGESSSTWSLARATAQAPNRLSLQSGGGQTSGLGRVNVQGVFSGSASGAWGEPCSLSAPTGSTEFAAVAPEAFELQVQPDPAKPSRLSVVFNGRHASLGNPYFGSECSTSVDAEPDLRRTQTLSVAKSAFKRKTVTLKWTGSTSEDGLAYRWSTTIVLKRVR